jgi:hypothetical protein
MKNSSFLLFFIIIFCSCSNKLMLPLNRGFFETASDGLNRHGYALSLFAKDSLTVVSSETARVTKVQKVEDYGYFLIAEGKYEITYFNLDTCFVKKGENIKKGKVIGKILPSIIKNSDTVYIASLGLTTKKVKTGKYITVADKLFK